MREIKFRAWDKTNTRMIYDNPLRSDLQLITFTGLVYEEGYLQDYELMQYTGLKDKNGKEIYEGDILVLTETACPFCKVVHVEEYYKDHNPYVVNWHKDDCCFASNEINGENWITPDVWKEMKIIGNIFENPNLIKEEK